MEPSVPGHGDDWPEYLRVGRVLANISPDVGKGNIFHAAFGALFYQGCFYSINEPKSDGPQFTCPSNYGHAAMTLFTKTIRGLWNF